jgi:transcriptional regulator with XRE-family HTH domain
MNVRRAGRPAGADRLQRARGEAGGLEREREASGLEREREASEQRARCREAPPVPACHPGPVPVQWPYGPGDLARRLSRRRAELKLTREQLAARARLSLVYVQYLEEGTARPTSAVLRLLAGALQTTPAALLGAGLDRAPQGGQAARQPELRTLTAAECYELLASGGVGRVAFSTRAGPVVLPVNYALAERTIVFRTGADTVLSAHAYDKVGFEVDRLDEALCQGWSVLVTGTAHPVIDQGELRRLRGQVTVQPWAGGNRNVYVRIFPSRISGRRIQTA